MANEYKTLPIGTIFTYNDNKYKVCITDSKFNLVLFVLLVNFIVITLKVLGDIVFLVIDKTIFKCIMNK